MEENSTSAKKLRGAEKETATNDKLAYRFIEFFTIFDALSGILACKTCGGNVMFGEDAHRGLGFKLSISCKCGVSAIPSGPYEGQRGYETNTRIVVIMRLLGVCIEGINLFCGMMDLSQGMSNSMYYTIVNNIYTVSKNTFEKLRVKAADEEKSENIARGENPENLIVSGDGTWKKRGFTSLLGMAMLIGSNTKKIIDLIVKSSFCQSCNLQKGKKGTLQYDQWYKEHQSTCGINHAGSAGKMEVDAMKEMFSR